MSLGDRMREHLGAEKPPDRERERALNRGVWPAGAALAWVVFSLLAGLVLFHPAFTTWLLRSGGGADLKSLLTGHLRCCQAIAAGMGIAVAGSGGFALLQLAWVGKHVRAIFRERRALTDPGREELMQQLGNEAVHAMAGVILLCGMAMSLIFTACFGYIGAQEGIWSFPQEIRADLRQLETGELEELEVWFHPNSRPACLPGPYSPVKDQPRPVTRFPAIGEDTGWEWLILFVPDGMRFTPDPERPFDETRTVDWNLAHAQRYQVRYTTNLHLAVEITPVC